MEWFELAGASFKFTPRDPTGRESKNRGKMVTQVQTQHRQKDATFEKTVESSEAEGTGVGTLLCRMRSNG